jgi:uncharacterized membrane protein YoaT (DUF817 family)
VRAQFVADFLYDNSQFLKISTYSVTLPAVYHVQKPHHYYTPLYILVLSNLEDIGDFAYIVCAHIISHVVVMLVTGMTSWEYPISNIMQR